jgi:cobalt-zinc-cadmium efflux system outer membrane protein
MWGSVLPVFEKATGNLETIHQIPSADQVETLLEQSPEMIRWMSAMEESQANLELEKAKQYPDVVLGGGFRHFADTSDHAFVLGISIPLPLFDRNQGGIMAAESNILKTDQERIADEVRIRVALEEAFDEFSSLHDEVTVLKTKIIPSATVAFEAAGEGYRYGKFGYLDVLDAQRTLYESREQLIDALAEYHTWKTRVEQLIGRSLDQLEQSDSVRKEKNDEKGY